MSWRPKVIWVGAAILPSWLKRVMRDDGVRLADEGVERLFRPGTHEGGELIDKIRLRGIKLGGEAPGKSPG